jgi:hypothetical protein
LLSQLIFHSRYGDARGILARALKRRNLCFDLIGISSDVCRINSIMNAQIIVRLSRYFGGIVLVLLGLALLIFLPVGSNGQQTLQQDQDTCKPWQYRDENGDCVDKPHAHHFHGEHHEAEAGEECWVECLCEEGQYPGGDSCAPCSFVGTVCISH